MERILLFGAPGSGKGTQGDLLAKQYGYIKISTGDLIRYEIKKGSEIGKNAKAILSEGGLISDDIIIEMVKVRLKEVGDIKGYIMDGFPRTLNQAETLAALPFDCETAILLDIDDTILVERLSSRIYCDNCGTVFNTLTLPPKVEGICDNCSNELAKRDDDNPDTVTKRIEIYKTETDPVVNFYREKGNLKTVDASGDVKSVFARLMGVMS